MVNETENGNSMLGSQITKSIKEIGVPTFFAIALGWIMIQYWIAPQTNLIKAMTESNVQLGKTFEILKDGMLANQKQLENVVRVTEESIKATNDTFTLVREDHKRAQDSLDVIMKTMVK